jgi:CHASE3 domain sensor protein
VRWDSLQRAGNSAQERVCRVMDELRHLPEDAPLRQHLPTGLERSNVVDVNWAEAALGRRSRHEQAALCGVLFLGLSRHALD